MDTEATAMASLEAPSGMAGPLGHPESGGELELQLRLSPPRAAPPAMVRGGGGQDGGQSPGL